MRIDHVLPTGEQWQRGEAALRQALRKLTMPSVNKGVTEAGGSDSVDISEAGQNLSELEKTVESLTEYRGWGNFNIDFSLDDQTGSLVISIIDRDSGELLRQIPPDQILNLRMHLQELLSEVFEHMG